MKTDETKVTLEEALAKKKSARAKEHLRGFGGNRFPYCDKEMSDEQAKRGLKNFARAALGIEEN